MVTPFRPALPGRTRNSPLLPRGLAREKGARMSAPNPSPDPAPLPQPGSHAPPVPLGAPGPFQARPAGGEPADGVPVGSVRDRPRLGQPPRGRRLAPQPGAPAS